jgi:hypothetical protein
MFINNGSDTSRNKTVQREIINYYCTYCLYGAVRNGYEAGKIHYEGHWNGWALEIVTFLGPEVATREASAFGPKKVEIPG